MCLPIAAMAASAGTLGTISTVASIGGTLLSVMGAMQQSSAAQASAKYNAQVAANNAKIAKQNASFASEEGEANVAAQQMKTRAEAGAIKASQAASGVDVGGKSALDVRSSAAELGELNAINIRSNAVRKAYGYQTDAATYKGQEQMDRAEASNAGTAGLIGAGSTLLGGAVDAIGNYSKYTSQNSLNSGA